ncbi:MAG: hypothetical protein RL885_26170 [Planctomycetota bacterium]
MNVRCREVVSASGIDADVVLELRRHLSAFDDRMVELEKHLVSRLRELARRCQLKDGVLVPESHRRPDPLTRERLRSMSFVLTTLASVFLALVLHALTLWYRRRRGMGPWPRVDQNLMPKIFLSMMVATVIGGAGILGWLTGLLPGVVWKLAYATGAIQLGACFIALRAMREPS